MSSYVIILMSCGVQGLCLWWFPRLENGTRECAPIFRVTLLSFNGKAFAVMLEMRLRMIVEPQIHKEVMCNPSWSGNIGPAIYSCKDTEGVMEVCP